MRRILAASAAVALLSGAACSSIPATPPQLPPPVTRLYPRPYRIVWDTVRVDLNNRPNLEVDTIDKAGRFVAWERTNNLFLLLNRRNVVTISLEPAGENSTRMVLQMSAQHYDSGGWTRPAGWYPSASVNEEMGLEIAASIDRRLGHTPGLADELALPSPNAEPGDAAAAPSPPAAPAAAPTATPPERTGWRRFLPRWPWRRGE